MCNNICGIVTTVIGVLLVVGSCIVSFVVVPGLVDNIIISEVVLTEDTIQLERFEEVPFPFHFKLTVWNISNPDEVLAGAKPVLTEIGPYVYKLYQSRNITNIEGERITYRRLDRFEFDAEASYPLTEDDMVTIVNVPYHAIIQIAEADFATLLSILSRALREVFGENDSPIITVRAGSLFFEGVRFCHYPGVFGAIACIVIRNIGATAQNLDIQADGSIIFSLLAYKDGILSEEYVVNRGINDASRLGDIYTYAGERYFQWWMDDHPQKEDTAAEETETTIQAVETKNSEPSVPSVCNTIKGSDSGIFPPFVDRERPLFAINTDICRTVELRYQYNVEVDGIPTKRFAANEWLLDNHEGCYCLNVTSGINREDGCLLEGAMELFNCVGATLVLTYPHFLYADPVYRDGVVGVSPDFEKHRIFLDLEPNTGTPIRGAKRAQFNIFMRPVPSIGPTQNLNTTLVPIVWIEEGIDIPDEYKEELRSRLLMPLNLLDIFIPIIIVVCCLVLVAGVIILIRVKLRKPVLTSAPRTDVNLKTNE